MTTRDRVFLLLLFVGFMTFVFEVRYEHRNVVSEHWEGWIPIIYSGLAALACLLGMAKPNVAKTVAASIFFLGIPVSLVGLYKHTEFSATVFEKFLFPNKRVTVVDDGVRKTVTLDKPVAAPLGILGLASIGFVITSGLFRQGKGG